MNDETPLAVVLRRKATIATTFVAFMTGVVIFTATLERVYSATSSLLVVLDERGQTFDAVQASQSVSRSYAEIMGNRNIAALVSAEIPGTTVDDIEDATEFEPLAETQLLAITAEDPDPEQATLIADTFAAVFIDYAEEELAEATAVRATLAAPAAVPDSPSRPKPLVYYTVGVMLAAGLGLALAFGRDRLDDRLRTSRELTKFEPPIVARIPLRGRSYDSRVAFQEAYRVLRANLQFTNDGRPVGSVAITSVGKEEGKTTTVAGLCLASIEGERTVIAVDGDLRRPRLQETLMPGSGATHSGLSEYLQGEVGAEQILFSGGHLKLRLVPPGRTPSAPPALLESPRGGELIEHLLAEAELVVVDTPPISAGADALVISSWVDGVLLVVDPASVTERDLTEALRQLRGVNANVLGFVVSRDREPARGAYSYGSRPGARDGEGSVPRSAPPVPGRP